ncbi:uncharacterized protein LOC127281782 isoform X2 [Leptopilina boulardi]|uniref:uncharacterized protein LOC127281782 isoform X2 n=1 Tax=Leptopilina boulardi TaxID=63433 RepID=UPI0021F5DE95|nr:uncharacterized protein LOC127281782 isoform X2 [Leptopilina boulardi]
MRNLMERQNTSWFALFLTAFYSVLASGRGEECGHEELSRCAKPLQEITRNSELSFFIKKQELDQVVCPKLEDSVKCINFYTLRCMKEQQRDQFNALYASTNMAIRELCQDGIYQEAFLEHVPCMQKETVKREYNKCSDAYQNGLKEMENSSLTGRGGPTSLKSLCCYFQTYLDCSHNVVLRECGADTAEFTKDFLDRMSNSLKESHCKSYPLSTCPSSSSSSISLSSLLLPVLIILSRYFT